MIISASRRTDIPCYYSNWFFNRLRAGYACVRNPMNPHQVSKVPLCPDVVDGIVFWTKNPAPMLDRLDALQNYTYYFQFTLTPYDSDIEKNLPSKNDVLVPTFQKLASRIGKERVVWRYDPILLSEKYTAEYHKRQFEAMCDRLAGSTEQCVISFLDEYSSIRHTIAPLGIYAPSTGQMHELAAAFSKTAREHGLALDTCAEAIELGAYGIGHAHCVDKARLERIGGYTLDIDRDKNQRTACGCAASIDLGAYNTCRNGCVYCYANYNKALIGRCCASCDPHAPLLTGQLAADDVVRPRKLHSCRVIQTSFLE